MNRKSIKISFTGDIMCEAIQINSHKVDKDKYDFSEIFSDMKNYFKKSDYVVGNLETPIAGVELGFCNKKFSFNTPEEFLIAIKNMGVDLVTTANNHCLDRGIEGLDKTIKNLDKYNLEHIGTYNKQNNGFIKEIGGIKVGFLSYTYGTNAFANNNYLKKNQEYMVNLFQQQELRNKFIRLSYNSKWKFYSRLYRLYLRIFNPNQLKRDVFERKEKSFPYMIKLKKEVKLLKKNGAEYIIMCAHMGGQYNTKAKKETKELVDKIIKFGVDAVIGNHEHLINESDLSGINNNVIKTYSLGNFSGLAGVLKAPYDKMAEYSIVFNIYLNKNKNVVNVDKCTFSIVKSIKINDGKIKTVLLYDLINNCENQYDKKKLVDDNLKIYNLFLNSNESMIELKEEYFIK